jgi:F-box/WD-40 domain protein 7
VWDTNSLSRIKTLTGHTDAVRALAVAEGRLFSGSYDGTVRVWDEASLGCLQVLKGHTGPVRTLVHARGAMFSGSYDKSVRVWDVGTLECRAALTGHTGAVRALVASPDYVFSGSDDTTIKVWDAATLQCVRTLEGHEDNVRVLAVGENAMFSGSWDKTIRVWDLRTLECVKVLEGHTEAVLALAGAFVCVGNVWCVQRAVWSKCRVPCCCTVTPPLRAAMLEHTHARATTVGEGVAGPNSKVLVSGSYDTTVRFWDLNTFRCVRKCDGHFDAVRVLAAHSGRVFSGSYDGTIGVSPAAAGVRLLCCLRCVCCSLPTPVCCHAVLCCTCVVLQVW